MSNLKILCLAALLVLISQCYLYSAKAKDDSNHIPEPSELMDNPNIKKLGSKKFMNLTEDTKVISVFDVYGARLIVVETENDMELIKVN